MFIYSLLKVQRIISTSCHALEYFTNNYFIFDANEYNEALAKLNETDRKIFYDRSTVNFNIKYLLKTSTPPIHHLPFVSQLNIHQYCHVGAYGSKVYLAKENPDNVPQARTLFRRLWFLDVVTKLLLTYWILKKIFSYFNVTVY